jgi:hypothetical protein
MGKVLSVGEAATWLAKPTESREVVANQLRRFRQKEFVRTRGTFGLGPTATNTFNPVDLGVAKVCRALTGLGIADVKVMLAVAEACYDLPSSDFNSGPLPGMEAALERPHAPWGLWVFLCNQEDGTTRVFAQIRLPDEEPEHPAVSAYIKVPLSDWLPSLAALAKGLS